MLCGNDNILQNIPHIQTKCGGIFNKILSGPQKIVIDLNNVMGILCHYGNFLDDIFYK